jgi:hypothetical protein
VGLRVGLDRQAKRKMLAGTDVRIRTLEVDVNTSIIDKKFFMVAISAK